MVEDDETLAMGIEYALREDESEVSLFSNHEAAASEIENMSKGDASYDLCLFDVMLPDGNGFDLLKKSERCGTGFASHYAVCSIR